MEELNNWKHLPAKEFDKLLGEVLHTQIDAWHAELEQAEKKAKKSSPKSKEAKK